MKFLSHIRSKSKLKSNADEAQAYYQDAPEPKYRQNWGVRNQTAKLPARLLGEILTYLCPHTIDDTYTASEESMVDGGCMLCDMRDLAQCALVNRQWAEAVQKCLYHSVRIDAVHYCDREADLAAKRKRRSFFERNGDSREPRDAPQQRLQLFSRTVRENDFLAVQVQFLKMPYMTRETCKSDLARTVSVLPNLRYVDLPEGLYSDDPSSNTLKQELRSRCPDIRTMRYLAGAEGSFTTLPQTRQWQNLERLELSRLEIEPSTLLYVLASFPALQEVKLVDLPLLDNTIFEYNPGAPLLPPLTNLKLEKAPNVSAEGLVAYFSRPETREVFTSLTLTDTGILPSTLYKIFAVLPYIHTVYISESISRALPPSPTPPLASRSLTTLHYEITSHTTSPNNRQSPSESYYSYLSSSILSGSLPRLSSLYALSISLPSLLLPLPSAPFANTNSAAFRGVPCPLNLYTKSISELEWEYTLISPPTSTNRRGSATATRPLSLYNSPQLSPQWAGRGRDSVMVGNGFGGFLAVPSEEAGPATASAGKNGKHKSNSSRGEAWMG